MRLGIVLSPLNTWQFFNEVFEDLKTHYEVDVFQFDLINTPIFYSWINQSSFHRKIKHFMKTHDVVFFEWASDWLSYAMMHPKECQVVTRLHSFELFEWAPKINWDSVDKVILVSQAMQQMFIEIYPDQVNKTEVIYNGVSLAKFKPAGRNAFNFNLGMLCNIVPIKRIYEMILTIDTLVKQGFEPHLHIAGKPTKDEHRYSIAINRLTEKLDLKNKVTFYDYVSDTSSWLQNIDIFISNSYWEGQSVSLLEAMASGCYCLSHHWNGAEEILPNENLFLTEGELIQKIIIYSQQPETEKKKFQEYLHAIACERFDIEQTKVKIRAMIEEVRVS